MYLMEWKPVKNVQNTNKVFNKRNSQKPQPHKPRLVSNDIVRRR
jgi:hypothetical protein